MLTFNQQNGKVHSSSDVCIEGKQVTFVYDEQDDVNADGARGHLVIVGDSNFKRSIYDRFLKRGIDICLSFLGLIVLLPVFIVISIAIVIEDPGPVFFTQRRRGVNKSVFPLHKFRSMKMKTPHDVPTHMLDHPEQYITRVGGFLRSHSLDELPQIWDILVGNMSIIGPRPALWNQDVLIAERDKYNANDIRPGLTGWAQINGRDELEIEEKAKLDGEYVERESFLFDTRCFLGTISKVFRDDSVVEGGPHNGEKENMNIAGIDEQENNTFSVLMSVYKNDDPDFLKLALESIYEKQTRKPDEIVMVFDGPLNDGLYNVLNEFKNGKESVVKYYPQEQNKGLGEALRIGSEYCTGTYIFRMDSDDISDNHRFEKQINYIKQHPEIDVLGTDIAEFSTSIEEEMRVRACPEDHEAIVKMAKRRNPMNHVTVCMKKAALEKAGGYRTLLLLEDYYLWLFMIKAGCRFANIHESLVYVRVGNGFDSKRGSKERIKGWKVIQKFLVENRMITKVDAVINMISIWGFVNTPVRLKKFLYDKVFRKKA